MKKKKLLLACGLIAAMLMLGACGKSNSTPAGDDKKDQQSAADDLEQKRKELLEQQQKGESGKTYDKGVMLMNSENVKKIGRTTTIDDVLWFSYSGSGVEFEFTGKKCELVLKADSQKEEMHQARYGVFVDGEEFVTGVMDEPKKTIKVVDADAAEKHIIKLIKLSETSDSTMGIEYAACDEEATLKPIPAKDLKIEFIGDSITCGYGVEEGLDKTYSTHNENCTKAYAYKTAMKLDADYSLVSKSGHGIITGYTMGDKILSQLMSSYYEKFGDSYSSFALGKKPKNIDWDFSEFVPDIIVINLGTNDNSYTKNFDDRKEEYVVGYVEFLKQVRGKNPNAVICGVLGVMGQELYPQIEDAFARYSEETGDKNVATFKLDVQDAGKNGYAVDYHPTEPSHEHASDQMVEFLSQFIKK